MFPIWPSGSSDATSRFALRDTHFTSHRNPQLSKPQTHDTMIRHDYSRVDPKRRANIDYKKKQFAKAEFQQQNYEHRLNFYTLPPTAEITLDEFETWAINRLKGG